MEVKKERRKCLGGVQTVKLGVVRNCDGGFYTYSKYIIG